MKKPKRFAAGLGIIIALCLLLSNIAFAGALEVVDITPKDGEGGKQPENMAVKITFSENMIDESAVKANEDKFQIKDPEGKLQSFKLTYSAAKYPDELWLILEESLESDTEYTVEILPGIMSAYGNTLGEGRTSTFKTRNVKRDQTISMFLMFGMMGFMFFATTMSAKKAAKEEGAGKATDEDKLNPYKIAKLRNISLEEATAYVEKEKAKIEKKKQRLEEQKRKMSEEKTEELEKLRLEILEEMRQEALAEGRFFVSPPRSLRKEGKRIPRSVINRNKAKKAAKKDAQKRATRNKKKK